MEILKYFSNLCAIVMILQVNLVGGHITDGGHLTRGGGHSSNSDNSPTPILEPINGTKSFRLIGTKGKEDKLWNESNDSYCVRPAKCEQLKNTTCLGSNLFYTSTSLALTDSINQRDMVEKLTSFQAMRHIPMCWTAIQPFLCAIYTPRCEKVNNRELVYLPSLEMCKKAMEGCRILNNTGVFPAFFRCDEQLYPDVDCKNDVREIKFNGASQCLKPLVQVDSPSSYYPDVGHCGVQCKDPLYTDDEHRQIHKLIGWGACICLGFNIFTVATFFIDWKNANKYPALVIFYINFCFMICNLGWLAQFTPGGREDIICRRDGTLRQSEPSAGENLSCVVVFVLVYYFLMAAMVWFVIFTYAWHMSFKAIGKIQDRIDKKRSYFHLIAWSLPLVLTITILALSEVDGSSVVGICFVGYVNHAVRAGLLLGPVFCVLIVGGYFLGRGMLTLIQLKITSKEIISIRASNKIRETIVRMGLCTLLILVFILTTFAIHINEFKNSGSWAQSLRKHIICTISNLYTGINTKCKMETRPSVAILQLHLLCFFASGIIMSSWVWTHSTVDAWSRYIKKKFGYEVDEPIKLQKHKLIAQAFARRKEFQNQGRLSISFHNSHTDPVGLNFDLNSMASHDFSSTWANNIPQFVKRRYALTGATTSSSHGLRRNSVDSEISFSVRHVSVESRRNSIDSQVSVKIAEMKTKVASRTRGSSKNNKNRHRRRDFPNGNRKFSRRESSTSMESQIITALQKAKYSEKCSNGGGGGSSSFFMSPNNTNMKRRSANAGLNPEQINALLSNGKLIQTFFTQNPGMTTSDEENGSCASYKVKDSRLDLILKQVASSCTDSNLELSPSKKGNGVDDDDDDVSRRDDGAEGGDIQEYNTTDDEKMNMRNVVAVKKGGGYPSIHDILDDNNRKNDETHTNLRGSKDGGGGRISKNSTKSTRSRRSSRPNSRRGVGKSSRGGIAKSYKTAMTSTDKKDKDKEISDFNDSSFTSYCSELSPLNVHSSYSGASMTKTNSRSSKRSCDVGIQTNSHEIATQTIPSYDFDESGFKLTTKNNLKQSHYKNSNGKKKDDELTDNIYTECHQLLPPVIKNSNKQRDSGCLVNNRWCDKRLSMSESEKLKMLLLPSK